MIAAEKSELSIRERLERQEHLVLSPLAAKSDESRGRRKPEKPCRIRPDFQHDRDRIIHCKAFRRLKHKTQVFLAPRGDHYRTRLTHTIEVSQIARTIAKSLFLNEDLTEAIALGHDLGHTPFGHAGEFALDAVFPGGFHHWEQSLRVVDELGSEGRGLNLTWEVRDGILKHSKGRESPIIGAPVEDLPATLEGKIVRVADIVAYCNHDLQDAISAGLVKPADVPRECLEVLGRGHSQRIDALVCDIVDHSWAATGLAASESPPRIGMGPSVQRAANVLREFLFQRVYLWEDRQGEMERAKRVVRFLFEYYGERPQEIDSDFRIASDPPWRQAADYVAGMTDLFALNTAAGLGFREERP